MEQKQNAWWDKLTAAEANQKEFAETGKRMIKYYEANYYKNFNDNMSMLDRVYVNILFEFVKVMVPFLYARDPEVICKPKKPGLEPISKFMQQVLQYSIRELDLKKTSKRVLLDALLPGWGIYRLGYSFQQAESAIDPNRFKNLKPEEQEVLLANPKNKDRQEGDPYVFAQIKQDLAWVVRWPWERFLIDPEATSPTDLSDAKWIAFKSLATKDTLKQEGVEEVKAEKAGDKGATIYDVWHRLSRKRYIFLEGEDEPVKEEEFPKWCETFPCVVMAFNEVPDKALPVCDGAMIESQIREKNYIRSQQVMHRRRFNRKYAVENNAMNPEEISKFEANVDGSLIKVNDQNKIPQPIQDAPLPADVYQVEARIDQDIARLTGAQEIQRGAAMLREQTATEASIMDQRLQLRTSERQDVVENTIQDVIRILAKIIQCEYDFPHYAQIVGEDGVPQMRSYTKEELFGEFDIEIHVGSMLPVNRQLMIRQAENAFNLLFGKGFNDPELARNYLEALDWKNIDVILTPPMPMGMPGMGGEPSGQGLINTGGVLDPSLLGAQAPTETSEAQAAGAMMS